jgi:hypothetical protein
MAETFGADSEAGRYLPSFAAAAARSPTFIRIRSAQQGLPCLSTGLGRIEYSLIAAWRLPVCKPGHKQYERIHEFHLGPKFKLGHCENQIRPLGVKTGQYLAIEGLCGQSEKMTDGARRVRDF